MKVLKSKKKIIIGTSVAAVLGISAAAFAYFTTTGQGTGATSTGTSTYWVVASTADTTGDLVPNPSVGSTNAVIDTIDFTITNPSAGAQNLESVTIQIAGSTGSGPNGLSPSVWTRSTNDATKPACTKADFSINGIAVGTTLTVNAAQSLAAFGTAFADMAPGAVYT
ncbi:MAG: hypothetical protein F2789_15765, partial [Actinobacteria bacterium]|nr:hypothetical protein [Actinomycetota bacterium]